MHACEAPSPELALFIHRGIEFGALKTRRLGGANHAIIRFPAFKISAGDYDLLLRFESLWEISCQIRI